MILNELNRLDLLQRSKTPTKLNRFARRQNVRAVSISRIGILEIAYGQSDLDVYFDINDGSYKVSIRFLNFMNGVKSLYNQFRDRVTAEGGISNSKTMREIVAVSIDNALTYDDIQVYCTCPDFYYRFAYTSTILDYNFNNPELIPAKIRNPNNQGSMCKHAVKVLSRPSLWKSKVVTGVMNVIKRDPKLIKDVI